MNKKVKIALLVGALGLFFCFVAESNISDSENVKVAPSDHVAQAVLIETASAKDVSIETSSPTPTPVPTSTPAPEPEEFLIWMGWTEFESGTDSWASTASDGGHAYGRYQFDDRFGGLAEFFRFCVNEDSENFESFTTFYYVDSKGKAHIKNTERIPEEWNWICITVKEDFYKMQTRFAFEYYYENAKKTLRQSGIDISGYSPVLQGTVMSLAIRDSFYKQNLSSLINTYYKGISEREWLSEIYAAEAVKHPDQETRWAGRQKDAAMAALTAFDNQKLTKKVCKKHAFETVQLSK